MENILEKTGISLLGIIAMILMFYLCNLIYEEIEHEREEHRLKNQIKIEQLKIEFEKVKGNNNEQTSNLSKL
jgi:hypothetical protein